MRGRKLFYKIFLAIETWLLFAARVIKLCATTGTVPSASKISRKWNHRPYESHARVNLSAGSENFGNFWKITIIQARSCHEREQETLNSRLARVNNLNFTTGQTHSRRNVKCNENERDASGERRKREERTNSRTALCRYAASFVLLCSPRETVSPRTCEAQVKLTTCRARNSTGFF